MIEQYFKHHPHSSRTFSKIFNPLQSPIKINSNSTETFLFSYKIGKYFSFFFSKQKLHYANRILLNEKIQVDFSNNSLWKIPLSLQKNSREILFFWKSWNFHEFLRICFLIFRETENCGKTQNAVDFWGNSKKKWIVVGRGFKRNGECQFKRFFNLKLSSFWAFKLPNFFQASSSFFQAFSSFLKLFYVLPRFLKPFQAFISIFELFQALLKLLWVF